MLIMPFIGYVAGFLCLASVIAFIYSLSNKSRDISIWISVVSGVFILYMIGVLVLIGLLKLPTDLGIIIVYFGEIAAGILYIITIIVNAFKIRKAKDKKPHPDARLLALGLIILPVFAITIVTFDQVIAINNSDVIVVYHSSGNGGLGDSDVFAFAINDHSCKQFDLGISLEGYYLHSFLPKNSREISRSDISNYDIRLLERDQKIIVEKDGEKICERQYGKHYFNNRLERIFKVEH